ALFFRILELPLGGFEEAAWLARHHLHALRATAQARAAAIYCGVADADDQHALANPFEVTERYGLEPCDADVNVLRGLLAAREIQLLALGRAGADEHGIESALLQKLAHALDRVVQLQIDAHVQDH